MDAALAAVLPRMGSSHVDGRESGGGGARAAGGIIGSTASLPSTSSPSLSPALSGLVLVSDSLGADAAFVVAHLLLKCIRDGQRVVLVAAAESGSHYRAVLKKLGLGAAFQKTPTPRTTSAAAEQRQQKEQQQDQFLVVPLWDDDALWMPESMKMLSCGATGLRRAAEAIRKAVEEVSADDENNDNTAVVFDSLSALAAAAQSEEEWESFVALEVLGSRASCVVARTDCVPGDDGKGGGSSDCDDGDSVDLSTLSSSRAGARCAAPWLSALRSAASLELTTRPLPSGAAVDVSGVLIARRGATAAMAPPASSTRRQRQQREEEQPPSLSPLSLSSPPPLAPPPRATAVFNYRLVDATVRLVPRRPV